MAATARSRATTTPTEPEHYVHAGPEALALTIDDGPSPVYTPQILAVLRRYGVVATFFMIGSEVEAHPHVLRAVVEHGHVLGNHTWSHPDMEKLSVAGTREEIERTGDLMARVGGGEPPTLFRAPGGHFTPAVMAVCGELRLRPVSWSVDPEDWSKPGTRVIVDRVLSNARTGSIILNHDGGGDRSQTVAALWAYLPRLIDAGYRFTVPDQAP